MFEAFGPDVVGSRKCLVAVSLIEHFADGIGMAKKKADSLYMYAAHIDIHTSCEMLPLC